MTTHRVYLDTCVLQRPLDTPDQPRIALEAEAVRLILRMCATGRLAMLTSDVLAYEVTAVSQPLRREHGRHALALATETIELSSIVVDEARRWRAQGASRADSLQVASAIVGKATHFVTCDDRLLRTIRRLDDMMQGVHALDPVEFVKGLDP